MMTLVSSGICEMAFFPIMSELLISMRVSLKIHDIKNADTRYVLTKRSSYYEI